MTSQLLSTYKQNIESLNLVPSSGGCFEISINGDLVYSKLKTGEFPEEKWAVDTIGAHLKKSEKK